MHRVLSSLLPLAVTILVLANTVTPLTAVNTGAGQTASTSNMQSTATLLSEVGNLTQRGPITIIGDANFTRENGVVGGSGTADDPYIIEGWKIDADGYDYGISIKYTTKYFVIRNCEIVNALMYGIALAYVENGYIANNTIANNLGHGVYLRGSDKNVIEYNNIISNIGSGLRLEYSRNNTIRYNNIRDHYDGINLKYSDNNTIEFNNIINNDRNGIHFEYSNKTVIKGNTIAHNNYFGIYIIRSRGIIIIYNNITNNYNGGIGLVYLDDGIIEYNNIELNGYGIALSDSGNDIINIIAQNNIGNNKEQVYSYRSNTTWHFGYPSGGNYWSDHICLDQYSGPKQDQRGEDGICDTPYSIYDEGYETYQYDYYPLAKPITIEISLPVAKKSSRLIIGRLDLLDYSRKGVVEVSSRVLSPSIPGNVFFIPADLEVNLKYSGVLEEGGIPRKPIVGREVKLFIDGELVSSAITSNYSGANIEGVFKISLPYGIHYGELVFDGDEEYNGSHYRFMIVAYKSTGFSIARDAYSFENWGFDFKEYLQFVVALTDRCMKQLGPEGLQICPILKIQLLLLYPVLYWRGHCFGMASTSAVYYIDPSLKPRNIDVYEMSRDDPDVVWNIELYHLTQVKWLLSGEEIPKAIEIIKSLVDSKTPVVIGYRFFYIILPMSHAVTVIGYYEDENGVYLIVYDNNEPNAIQIYSIENGKLILGDIEISKLIVVDPHDVRESVSNLENIYIQLMRIQKMFYGLLIHSPVDITISSSDGGMLLVVNGTVVRNDFAGSYVYVSDEYKIFLLPSDRSYSVELTATDRGSVTIETIYTLGENLTINTFRNITVDKGSKIYLQTIQSEKADIDTDGDGKIDTETKAEVTSIPITTTTTTTPTRETTSLLPLLIVVPIIIAAAIAVILLLKRR